MNTNVLQNITYGLYLLSAQENGKDNACIINTAVQVVAVPAKISVSVAKNNLTHDMVKNTGTFNLSVISNDAKYDLFTHFGMQSGRNVDKFADFSGASRSENGLYYLTKHANAFISVKVTETVDLGSHTMFIGEVTDGEILSDAPTCTYDYYHSNIKELPPQENSGTKGWRCIICGYVYEGETLPADYVCPLCNHGPEDFEPIG